MEGAAPSPVAEVPPPHAEAASPLASGGTVNAEVATPPSELESLLSIARARLNQGQLLDPATDSAVAYWSRAAAIDSTSPRVLELRADLAAAVANGARLVLERDELDEAEAWLDAAFSLGADSETLTQLDLDLSAARTARAEQHQDEIFASALQRLREGRLMAPENDSALFYLTQLRAENPDYPGLVQRWDGLVDLLDEDARGAIKSGDWVRARTIADTLENAGADADIVQALREDLIFERQQAEYLRVPAGPGELRALRTGTIDYPEAAARRNVEGTVEVEFIVDTDGLTTQARVTSAEPEGYFEDAALATVAQYRYAPFERDGRRYRRLAQVRIRFGLQ
jgi:TonB family protein